MLVKVVKQLNPIGSMKILTKPDCSLYIYERLTILKNIYDKHITLMNKNLELYEVHSMIIYLGSRVSYFTGNLRTRKPNKAQTKRVYITGVQYNSLGSTGGGVNFVLYFFLLSLCANSHLSPLSIAAVSFFHFCDPLLQSCV